MKKLTYDEFHDRVRALSRARKIFIPMLTKNISIAFELYQEVLAETERDLFLTAATGGRAPMTWLDQFERPVCPECGEPLYLRIIKEPKGPKNQKGWVTCWGCLGPSCFYEGYSKKNVAEWVRELRKKKKELVDSKNV